MDDSLKTAITQIINDLGVGILDDKDRFLSAIIDLGEFSKNERSILIRTIDDGYMSICKRALNCDSQAVNAVVDNAAGYLQQNHQLAENWSYRITSSIVSGIWTYSNPNAEPVIRNPERKESPNVGIADGERTVVSDGGSLRGDWSASGDGSLREDWNASGGRSFHGDRSASGDGSLREDWNASGGRSFQGDRSASAGEPAGSAVQKRSFLPVLIIAIAVLVAGLCIAFWTMSAKEDDQGNEGLNQGAAVSGEEAKSEDQSALSELDGADCTVLKTDADWDSSEYESDEGYWPVRVIMHVQNDSDRAIVAADFEIDGTDGKPIENMRDGGNQFRTNGYVEAGHDGIMVGKAYAEKEKCIADNADARILTAYVNDDIGDYVVPTGKLINYTKEDDTYDVSINNPNDVEVNEGAMLVAAKMDHVDFQEADAGGVVTKTIPPQATDFKMKKVFKDPTIYSDYERLTVYVIDIKYLDPPQ